MRLALVAAALPLCACSGTIDEGNPPDLQPLVDAAFVPTLHFTAFQKDSAEDFFGVWGTGKTEVFVVGQASVILHTTNGGLTWPVVNGGDVHAPTLRAVSGVTGLVLAVGDSATILASTDGGSSWTTQSSGLSPQAGGDMMGSTLPSLRAVALVSATEAWSAGDGGALIHTTDGGATWSSLMSGTTQDLRALLTVGSDVYAAGAGGTLLKLSNGAPSTQTSGTTASLYALGGTSGDLFAAGAMGTVRHGDGKTWSAATSGTTETLGGLGAVAGNAGAGMRELFGATVTGKFIHTIDDGKTWELIDPGMSGIRGHSLWVSSTRSLYLAAEGGIVLHGSY